MYDNTVNYKSVRGAIEPLFDCRDVPLDQKTHTPPRPT